MHITLSGKLGSGKSTICKYLEDEYEFQTYSVGKLQREIAANMNISILELNHLQQTDKHYDNIIDKELIKTSVERQADDIIFDSRIAFKLLANTFNVYTTIDPIVAASRVLQNTERGKVEQYTSIKDAVDKLTQREQTEVNKFKALYSVDIADISNYDLVIDTTYLTPEVVGKMILKEQSRVKGRDMNLTVLISPKSVYPTERINHINSKVLNEYFNRVSKGIQLPPIKVAFINNYYYIIEGHHQVLAYLKNKINTISCILVSQDEYKIANKENLHKELSYVGMSTLYDYEEIGDFVYASYPASYCQD